MHPFYYALSCNKQTLIRTAGSIFYYLNKITLITCHYSVKFLQSPEIWNYSAKYVNKNVFTNKCMKDSVCLQQSTGQDDMNCWDTPFLILTSLRFLFGGLVRGEIRRLFFLDLSQLMRLLYLSHRRRAKAQAILRIRAVSPVPSLFAHMKYGSRRRVRPKIRYVYSPTEWLHMRVWRMSLRGPKVP